MNGMTPLREDELHAYVDGRLDPGRREEVERRIAADPALRARIEDWEAQAEALRAVLAPLAREPAPPELNPAELLQQQLARRAAPWRIAASVALVFALGAAAGAAPPGHCAARRAPPRSPDCKPKRPPPGASSRLTPRSRWNWTARTRQRWCAG